MTESRGEAAVPQELRGAVATLFGATVERAEAYATLLATSAVDWGLIGPREVPRLWDRHLLNCVSIEALLPPNCSVVDVGSGAGLPGLVLAIARPDLSVTLVESLQRRVTWLEDAIEVLSLGNVQVRRGRAEAMAGGGVFDCATARAVAPLDTLARWCLPLVRPGGRFIAIKGQNALIELASAEPVLLELRAASWSVVRCGAEVLTEPTTAVVVDLGEGGPDPLGSRGRGRSAGRAMPAQPPPPTPPPTPPRPRSRPRPRPKH